MVEGYEIKVPITLKGGNEGEKVGKQIGSKIAEQIQRAYKSIGFGGGAKTGGGGGGGEVGAISGLSKGLGKVALKIGAVVAVAAGILSILKKSSPYLRGILSIFGRAFTMFFRPFGDFLATLLRPMAILMMKMAVAFLKWTRSPVGQALTPTIVTIGGIVTVAALGTLAQQALGIAAIGTAASTATPLVSSFMANLKLLAGLGLITLGVKLAYDVLTAEEFGAEEVLKTIGAGLAIGLGASLLGFSAAAGITIGVITITAILGWKFVSKQADAAKAFADLVPPGMRDVETDLEGRSRGAYPSGTRVFESTPNFNIEKPKSKSKGFWDNFWEGGLKQVMGFAQGGTVPGLSGQPQLAVVHGGETITPKTKSSSNSVILKPTFQITGNVSRDIDMDAIVRRAGRMTEMDLKRRGVI